MGFDAEWQLAGCMKTGSRGSGYPVGWLSEKKPCPICTKPVAGRHVGMAEHIATKHDMKRAEAMRFVLDQKLTYAANAPNPPIPTTKTAEDHSEEQP